MTVIEIQQQLEALGYSPGPLDGLYGPLTQAAVRAFQSDRGLESDGIPGPSPKRPCPLLPIPVPMRKKPAVTGTIPLLTIRTASGGYSSAFGHGEITPGNLPVAVANGATATLEFSVTTAADTNNSILLFEWYPGIQLSADL